VVAVSFPLRTKSFIYQSIALNVRVPNIICILGSTLDTKKL